MTRLLLDTTFLIDAERSGAEVGNVIEDDDDVAIAAVTWAELKVGALLAKGRRRSERLAFAEDIAEMLRIEAYDARVADDHALLLAEVRRQGRPRGAHDLIIAATAKTYGRTVVTADESAFDDLPGITVRPHR